MDSREAPDWWPQLRDHPSSQSLEDWRAYDKLFGDLRQRPAHVLILGMDPRLVNAWLTFLPRARVLRLGREPAAPHPRLMDFIGNPSDSTDLDNLLMVTPGRKFDAVIDDGFHLVDDVWKPFDMLFELWLQSGGIYAIQAWAVGYLPTFEQGSRPRLMIQRHATRLGGRVASHTHGLPGLIKAMIDHVPAQDILASGASLTSVLPIRSVTALPNVVGVERR